MYVKHGLGGLPLHQPPKKSTPLKLKKNSSNFRITALNIKGMRIGTNFEQSKLMALINDGGDVTLLIDHHLDNENCIIYMIIIDKL